MADDAQGGGDGDGESAEPLAELAERIRDRRSGEQVRIGGARDDTDDFDQYFQDEAFDEFDTDDVWEALAEGSDITGGVESVEGADEHIVPKRSYCEACEYFSEPPDVHCNHAGTSIREYVDLGHIRVRNCPIVAKRQSLGEIDEPGMTQMSFGKQGQD